MNELERWVEERSQTRGATRVILKYIAEEAEGCIAVVSMTAVAHRAKISRRQGFYSIEQAEKLREVERIEGVSIKSATCLHLRKWCEAFFPLGSDSAKKTCLQLAGFRARYGGSARAALLRGRQSSLPFETVPEWAPVITDEELRWRSDELKQRLGIAVRREGFMLRMPA